MMKIAASWRPVAGCAAAGIAAVVGLSGAVATAEPTLPTPPSPGYSPVTVTQTVTVAPQALGAAPTSPATGPTGLAGGTAAAVPSTRTPAESGTLRDYFAANDVRLEPQQSSDFTALNITLPVPPGWTRVPDPNVPDAFAVIADRNSGALYPPNAQLVVYRLVGQFDPAEAITHGFVDSQQLFAWRTTNASLADFGGFPSSLIDGTYRQGDTTINTSQRHVIATAGTANYLVSLTVNTDLTNTVGNAPATDAVVNGFRVALPGTAPAVTAPAPAGLPQLPVPAGVAAGPRG